jgi:hypothetical protein
VPQLDVSQRGTKHVPRILVLEKQADLIETQVLRLNKALPKELAMDGHLSQEVRANIELLDRLLHRYFVTQQDVGLEPKLTPAVRDAKGEGGSAGDNATNRATLADLVGRLVDLPTDQYLETLVAVLGPPPIKQPLQIDGVVIEKKPLEPDDATPGEP